MPYSANVQVFDSCVYSGWFGEVVVTRHSTLELPNITENGSDWEVIFIRSVNTTEHTLDSKEFVYGKIGGYFSFSGSFIGDPGIGPRKYFFLFF